MKLDDIDFWGLAVFGDTERLRKLPPTSRLGSRL